MDFGSSCLVGQKVCGCLVSDLSVDVGKMEGWRDGVTASNVGGRGFTGPGLVGGEGTGRGATLNIREGRGGESGEEGREEWRGGEGEEGRERRKGGETGEGAHSSKFCGWGLYLLMMRERRGRIIRRKMYIMALRPFLCTSPIKSKLVDFSAG